MSDDRIRQLERQASEGDTFSAMRLERERERASGPPARLLRQFSSIGPCFRRGQIVRETAKFYIVTGNDDCSNHKAWDGEQRIAKVNRKHTYHTETCTRCTMEYMD